MLLGPIKAKLWMKKEKNENAEMSPSFCFFCHNFLLIELWFMSTLSEGKAKNLKFCPSYNYCVISQLDVNKQGLA